MADPEANKRIVLNFFEGMNSRDPDRMREAVALMAPEATYWIQGDWPNGGTFTRDQLAAMVTEQTDVFDGPLEIMIQGMTAEGERVAVEMESRGRFLDGRPYNNSYHWLFVLDRGRILRVKEYVDTLYANTAYYG